MTDPIRREAIRQAPAGLEAAVQDGVYTDLRSLTRLRSQADDLGIFSRGATRSLLLGNVRSRFRGRGMEFEEVRLYQPGDDVRSIDWRVSARMGRTHTKIFAEERERPVHLIVDQRSSMFFGSGLRFKSVLAAELAACVGWAALGASDRIGGQVFGDQHESAVRARRNKKALLQFLTALTEFNQALPQSPRPDPAASTSGAGEAPSGGSGDTRETRSLEFVLEECRRLTRPGTAIFLVSDFHDFDDRCQRLLSALGRHMEVTLYWVRDPIEVDLGLDGRLGLSDGQSARSFVFGSALRKRYEENRRAAQDRFEEAARRSRATLVPISTDDDPVPFLRRLYRG